MLYIYEGDILTAKMRAFSKNNQSVSNAVQKFRKANSMTQEDLARATGVTRQTIISIEKGKYTPSLPSAMVLAKTFNAKVEDIFSL